MANTKSAAKAYRQSVKRRARNLTRAKAYKSILKEFRKAAAEEPKKAREMVAMLQKKLDKAAKVGVIAKNKASRLKSGAAKLLAKSSKLAERPARCVCARIGPLTDRSSRPLSGWRSRSRWAARSGAWTTASSRPTSSARTCGWGRTSCTSRMGRS